jgi:CheY-like chemotaxis protein
MAGTILVVEDNEDNLMLMDYILNAYGYSPVLATSGREGIERARENEPDLILMDVQMPDMDGYEATARIKDSLGRRRCPVVAVTAFAMVGDIERILAGGFDGYISKPISPSSFVPEIESYLPAELRSSKHPAPQRPV